MSQTFAAQVTFSGPFSAIPGGEHVKDFSSCGACVSMRVIRQRVEPEFNARRLVGMALRG